MALHDWINTEYLDEEKQASLRKLFFSATPFAHLQLPDFFIKDKLVEVLRGIGTVEFTYKESDLFKFHQTHDLQSCENALVSDFRDFLYSTEFIAYMQNLTGFTFTKEADLAGTLYSDTNFLLCHDDQLDDRKIAFLVYLSTLLQGDGGELLLFDNKDGNPTDVSKRLVPEFNTLSFFEVSDISFHEVSEVLVDKNRITIGGWYYEDQS
ncbi:MAG: Rps23 Pro-64 3,4-dihydroxylase Tpa1-like proline 4-hydroxylase [Candidatus Woesearchaeota archaeon]|jgi:Rps23 Pro-64 3,4-dihydroxylase Tpa1-like proline 4-hydroxylase